MLEFLLPAGLVEGDPPYWFALVGSAPSERLTGHGASAGAATGQRSLLLEPGGDTDAFLSEYDQRGSFLGDTWYGTREEALEDASQKFGPTLGEWRPVPATDIGTAELYLFGRPAT
jgi:hypothetical protein